MKFLILLALIVTTCNAEEKGSEVLAKFATGNKQFTAAVYQELLKSNSGNFLVCPLSVEVIMGLVLAGAKGNTAKQLATGLRLPENIEQLKQTFKELAPALKGNEHYQLSSANKVYLKKDFQISDSFKDITINTFDADIQAIDFVKAQEAAATINKWAEEKTHNKIKDLIKPDDLNEDTRAVLINALYFHGKWVKQFSEYATRKRDFHLNAKDQVQTDMMELTDNFQYYESPELKAKFLELPYEGGDVTMTIVLPDEIEGLSALESRLADVLAAPKYTNERVNVVIPKFKIETTIQFKPILQALGIKDAFENNSDLGGIGANKESLKISKVIQKAFIEVEEKGTTAAAATAVISVIPLAAPFPPRIPKPFVADHPFLYYLKYSNRVILFAGRCTHLK